LSCEAELTALADEEQEQAAEETTTSTEHDGPRRSIRKKSTVTRLRPSQVIDSHNSDMIRRVARAAGKKDGLAWSSALEDGRSQASAADHAKVSHAAVPAFQHRSTPLAPCPCRPARFRPFARSDAHTGHTIITYARQALEQVKTQESQ
jgi:hypothetical protein